MPDLWMDVDVALAEVPVNIMPLIDDSDFKTREEAVAYDAAGIELIWHFTTTAGATTATVVTPTTGGDYDWAHQDGGMYTIEMTDTGGASANNDTEGFGWFTGVATGVLPWRGPTIGFRAAALNNALIDGNDVLDVSLTEIGGVAQSAVDLKDFADTGYVPGTHSVALVDTTTTNTDMVGTNSAALASVCTEGRLAELDAGNLPTDIAAIPTTAMRGTDSAALASVCTEGRLAELDAANLPTDIAAIPTTAMRGTDSAALATGLATHDGKLDTVDTVVDAVKAVTDNLPDSGALNDLATITGTAGVELGTAQTAAWASQLEASAGTIIEATVDTVTNTHTPTTTEFQADDVTEATADHYNGRIVIFKSGVLTNQATDITDYAAVGGIGQFTVTAMTEAPANNDTFIIV